MPESWKGEEDFCEERSKKINVLRIGEKVQESHLQTGRGWRKNITVRNEFDSEAITKSCSGVSRSQHWMRLIQACLTPSYLVEESLEDAGGFD